jgi:PiT family inorganic phosphate transporter
MLLLATAPSLGTELFLVLALTLALGFEFVNGFHDTANAVATVIYTHALPPRVAVVWSGCWNLVGVLCSSGAVAFSILALLPVELIVNIGSSAGIAMVFALLVSAIVWNLGTWYLGLPASSSHALVGSIMGVALAHSIVTGHAFAEGINWHKVGDVFSALLISPIVGFACAAALLLLMKRFIRNPALYAAPDKKAPPPGPIRGLLILTCTGVSFAHGSNDGQKGMGLILLILVAILPSSYALNMETDTTHLQNIVACSQTLSEQLDSLPNAGSLSLPSATDALSDFIKTKGVFTDRIYPAVAVLNRSVANDLSGKTSFHQLSEDQIKTVRVRIYLLNATIEKIKVLRQFNNPEEEKTMLAYQGLLVTTTRYIPLWVKIAVALALGLGTMVGWKRVVVTVGEKIGKDHLTYAQGAAAELVAMSAIGAADVFGLPVSTTHVLSSGIAGTMAANRSGLQMSTLRNLLLAWVLTLPVCVLLGAGAFSATLLLLFSGPWVKAVFIIGLIIIGGIVFRLWYSVLRRAKSVPALGEETQLTNADSNQTDPPPASTSS